MVILKAVKGALRYSQTGPSTSAGGTQISQIFLESNYPKVSRVFNIYKPNVQKKN